MISYTIPADFKLESPCKIKELEEKYPDNKVREVFGNLSGSEWSSGHGFLPKQTFAKDLPELEKYIIELDKYGYDFNYTFNAEYLNNADITESGLEKIGRYVENLVNIGVKRITIASPALMLYIRERFPRLKITVSSITNVDSVIRAKELDSIGVDTIVFGEDLTRNFQMLNSIKDNINASTEIIVNSKCTFNCLYRVFHYASVNCPNQDRDVIFNYGKHCFNYRQQDPVQYIKSLWIRPEDIEVYSENGVDLFKIIGREQLNKVDLYRMVETYFSQNYEGNLLDLIFGYDTTIEHYYIDNKKLDGFIKKFLQEPFFCLSKCTDNQCDYCKSFLKRANKEGQ